MDFDCGCFLEDFWWRVYLLGWLFSAFSGVVAEEGAAVWASVEVCVVEDGAAGAVFVA